MSDSPMRQHDEIVAAKLVLSAADGATRSHPVGSADVRIGRRPFNELVLDDLTVSGTHAVIVSEDGRRKAAGDTLSNRIRQWCPEEERPICVQNSSK